jgi:hypothetical protein
VYNVLFLLSNRKRVPTPGSLDVQSGVAALYALNVKTLKLKSPKISRVLAF